MLKFSRNGLFKSAGLLFAASLAVILLAASPSLAADETYFSGDNITVHLLLDTNDDVPAQLQLMVYNPENRLVGNSTHHFTLETGKNQVDFTIPFYTDMDGLHYLRYDIFAELDGDLTLVQSSSQYFDGEVNDPPVIKLLSPKNGGTYPPGEEIQFSVNVLDPEGQNTSVIWTSNVSGTIGTGTSFSLALEPEGVHRINVSAEDEMGAVSTRSIIINVAEGDGDGGIGDDGGDGTVSRSSGEGTGFATVNPKVPGSGGEESESGESESGESGQVIVPEDKPGTEDSGTQGIPGEEADKEEDRGLPGFELGFAALGLLLAAGFRGRKRI
ncbi:hypothetical protein FTO70_00880 [Methanosarcina sp. KYL-1]|uniref:PKD domain-containing protein n=1 Tax=Methanosarcina sp. KYL-1 TaxID=2602068 RepID=UPI002100AA24|nr:PKD domain-containing protein [Methanosarcina sp. KYL-1]MCQ1534273.1 hypothetical protein [Methanosarcina sp. KYL-1]